MAGSRAVSDRESGQVREEAALSGPAHAPRISLAGAEGRRARPEESFDGGCTVHYSAKASSGAGVEDAGSRGNSTAAVGRSRPWRRYQSLPCAFW